MPSRRVVVALVALACCTGALANEVQFHICAAGQNLGAAYARVQYFSGEIGPDHAAEIAANLANAAAHIAAAEAGVQQPFFTQPDRQRSIAELQRKLAAYAEHAARQSPAGRMALIQGYYTHYRGALSLSYASNRPDASSWNSTCDSRMLDANWHLGRAGTYAAVRFDRATVHEIQARSAQSGANASAYHAIRDGLRVALDGTGPTPIVHCYFNTEAAWSIVPMLRPDEPHATYVDLLPRVLEVCRGAGPIRASSQGGGGSGSASGGHAYCASGGVVSGVGGDGKPYSAHWRGPGNLVAIPYSYGNKPFLRFELNGRAWPDHPWGVSADSWELVCLASDGDDHPERSCTHGGTLEGIGGDGQHYSATWSGYGEIETIPYLYEGTPFYHFRLNGTPWPNSTWGVSQATWRVTCH